MSSSIALTNAGAKKGSLPSPAPSGDSSRPQFRKASLEIYEAKPVQKHATTTGAPLGPLEFQFNPKEVTIQKSAKWERKTARGSKTAGPPEFSGSEPCKLSFEMFLDGSGEHDGGVVAAVETLLSCLVPTDASIDKKKAMPPLVVFRWGNITSFPGFVTQVSAKYTLFAAEGTPIRATCSVSIEEMPQDPGKQNPTSGSIAARRAQTLVSGDSLASLAYREYGDAALWRALAVANGIDDPIRVRPGNTILMPPPEDLVTTGG